MPSSAATEIMRATGAPEIKRARAVVGVSASVTDSAAG